MKKGTCVCSCSCAGEYPTPTRECTRRAEKASWGKIQHVDSIKTPDCAECHKYYLLEKASWGKIQSESCRTTEELDIVGEAIQHLKRFYKLNNGDGDYQSEIAATIYKLDDIFF